MLLIQSPIGMGKTNLTNILTETLGTNGFYEEVDGMPMLEKFYSAGEESRFRLAFPLQIAFLNYRFGQLLEANTQRNAVLDSSLLSDSLMAKNLLNRGEFPKTEFDLYQDLVRNMINSVARTGDSQFPDLIVYLDGSFDLMLDHIEERGRGMEIIDDDKRDYYKSVHDIYDHWYKGYSQSPVIRIDMDKYDYVNNMSDRKEVLTQILTRMVELGMLKPVEFEEIKTNKLDLLTDTNS